MPASFFVDETDLGLGKKLAERHSNVLYPGHPGIPTVPRGCSDETWLEIVGELRLVVVTRDRKIRLRPVEKRAWVEHRVRGFVLTGTPSQSTARSSAVLDKHWNRIEAIVAERGEGPWM